MRRRQFLRALAIAAMVWPAAANAQPAGSKVRIGFLHSASAADYGHLVDAFRQGLEKTGYVEGQNAVIEYRWAEGNYERLATLAADLVARHVQVIIATGGEPSALAAATATKSIPIVFTTGDDPVKAGLVASINRPGRNATGVSILATALVAKRLGMLHKLLPKVTNIYFLANPNFPNTDTDVSKVEDAGRRLGLDIRVLHAAREHDFARAFEKLRQQQAEALIINTDPFFFAQRDKLVALAARHAIPTMYYLREFVSDSGLISYGANLAGAYHQVGVYAGQILNGENPANLPVIQPAKFELVINLKTARALGLKLPHTLLAIADDVIEQRCPLPPHGAARPSAEP